MIESTAREAAAAALDDARRTRVAIEPPTDTWPGFDVDDAYAVQALGIERRQSAGATVVGWKVGLTSEAMQRQLGVDEPDFGQLLDEMQLAPGAEIDLRELIAPKIEAELAFRLGADLSGPGVRVDEVAAAVDSVLPALEIIDSRVVDWRIKLADTIADHASCASFVLGEGAVPLADVDLLDVAVTVAVDGRAVERGVGSAVLGNPLEAIVWLADTIAAHGLSLRAGQVIMAGALHASVPLAPGASFEARFSDSGLGSVSVRCG